MKLAEGLAEGLAHVGHLVCDGSLLLFVMARSTPRALSVTPPLVVGVIPSSPHQVLLFGFEYPSSNLIRVLVLGLESFFSILLSSPGLGESLRSERLSISFERSQLRLDVFLSVLHQLCAPGIRGWKRSYRGTVSAYLRRRLLALFAAVVIAIVSTGLAGRSLINVKVAGP